MRLALLAATALTTTISFLVPGVGFAQSLRDWSGGYIGVTTGVIYSDAPVESDNFTDAAFSPRRVPIYARGAMLGVTAGYNHQVNGIVTGVEADLSLANMHGERSTIDSLYEANLDALLTLRGRLGVASGRSLFYGTAGFAAGQANFSATLDNLSGGDLPIPAAASGIVTGVVAGAGVEYALTDNMSIKTEGLTYQLASLSGTGDTGKGTFDSDYAPGGVMVRTGLNVSF